MHVVVNGEKKIMLAPLTLNEALTTWGYNLNLPMAIAVNYSLIPNTAYPDVELKEQDIIEILMPMQGG